MLPPRIAKGDLKAIIWDIVYDGCCIYVRQLR